MPAMKANRVQEVEEQPIIEEAPFNPGPFNMKPPLPGYYLTHPAQKGRRGCLGQPCEFSGSGADDDPAAVWYCLEEDIYMSDESAKSFFSYKKRAAYSRRRWLVEDSAAVKMQAKWRHKSAKNMAQRLIRMHEVYNASVCMQSMYRCRKARAELRLKIHEHYDKIYDRESHEFFYYNNKSGTTLWEKPKGLNYGAPKCKSRHYLLYEALHITLDIESAAFILQGMWKRRKARAWLRDLFRKTWKKTFDATSNSYYFYNVDTGETKWKKPSKWGETPRKERDVMLWPVEGEGRWADEGSVVMFFNSIGLGKYAKKIQRLELDGTILAMMAPKDYYWMGLNHMEITRVQSNLREMLQNMTLPDHAAFVLNEFQERLKEVKQEDEAHQHHFAQKTKEEVKVRDPLDALPDVKVFKWQKLGGIDNPKKEELWYTPSVVYGQLGTTKSLPNKLIVPEYKDSSVYFDINTLRATQVSILGNHKRKERLRVLHSIMALRQHVVRNETRDLIIAQGVIESIVRACNVWGADSEVQAQGLHTLGMFAFEQATVEKILDAGGVQTAINAAATHTYIPSVQQEATYLFIRLSHIESEASQVVGGMGIDAILAGMKNCVNDPDVQYWGVKALLNFCRFIPKERAYWAYLHHEHAYMQVEYAQRQFKTEGAEDLLKILKHDPGDDDKARQKKIDERNARRDKKKEIEKRKQLEAEEEMRKEAGVAAEQIEYDVEEYL